MTADVAKLAEQARAFIAAEDRDTFAHTEAARIMAGLLAVIEDDDYSPSYQDEYQRLWHESAALVEEQAAEIAWVKAINQELLPYQERAVRAEAERDALREAIIHVVADSPGTPSTVKQYLSKALAAGVPAGEQT